MTQCLRFKDKAGTVLGRGLCVLHLVCLHCGDPCCTSYSVQPDYVITYFLISLNLRWQLPITTANVLMGGRIIHAICSRPCLILMPTNVSICFVRMLKDCLYLPTRHVSWVHEALCLSKVRYMSPYSSEDVEQCLCLSQQESFADKKSKSFQTRTI
jgi:hypothetical protein